MRSLTAIVLGVSLFSAPAVGDTLADIKERGTFSFGLEAQYMPFGFRGDNNEIIGFDIDVAAEIGERLGGGGTRSC